MGEISTIGIDLAKHVFQLHGSAADGAVLFRRRLRREKLLEFLASQAACVVAMEACASAHYWAREIQRLGHEVRLPVTAITRARPLLCGAPLPRSTTAHNQMLCRNCISRSGGL